MFGIFNLLPSGGWFEEPLSEEGITAEVCHDSGHLAGMDCTRKDTLLLPKKALRSDPCPYHKTVEGVRTFILPPSMEWYYRQHHPEYKPYIPEKKEGNSLMEFIYPEEGATITIPRQLDGSIAGVTFNLAHRTPDSVVYWHLDNEYLGETRFIHQMNIKPASGRHVVTVMDEDGNSLSVSFIIT